MPSQARQSLQIHVEQIGGHNYDFTFVARVPELDGIAAIGGNRDQALENLAWALRGVRAESHDQEKRALAAALLEGIPT